MRRWLLLGWIALAGGCDAANEAGLLQVEEISPVNVDPETVLHIRGAGFPSGKPGLAIFRGSFRQPGRRVEPVEAEVEGVALSQEHFRITGTDALVDGLGGRGTFHGSVQLEFDGHSADTRVVGRLTDVEVDFAPSAVGTIRHDDLERRREAAALVEYLGVVLVGDDEATGLLVDGVVRGGPAERAGMEKGDRIVAIDRTRVREPTDLLPVPGMESAIIEVVRARHSAPVRLFVSLEGLGRAATTDGWRVGAVLFGVLVFVLLFCAPTARIVEVLVRAVRSPRVRRSDSGVAWFLTGGAVARGAEVTPPRSIRRFIDGAKRASWLGVAGLSVSVALGVLPFTAHLFPGGFNVGFLVLLFLGARLFAVWSSPEGGRVRTLVRGLVVVARDALVVGAPVGAAALASGSVRLTGLVESQGGLVWEFAGFEQPILFLSIPGFFVAAFASWRVPRGAPSAAQVAERIALLVLAGIATAGFFGGWLIPFGVEHPLQGSPAWRLAASVTFIAKAWFVLWLGLRLRSLGAIPIYRWAVPIAILGLGLAAATLVWPPPLAVARISGPVLAGCTAAIFGYVVYRSIPDLRLGVAQWRALVRPSAPEGSPAEPEEPVDTAALSAS
ncbi:MAG: PDZ domain-containing protein [Myxococcota bacterium]